MWKTLVKIEENNYLHYDFNASLFANIIWYVFIILGCAVVMFNIYYIILFSWIMYNFFTGNIRPHSFHWWHWKYNIWEIAKTNDSSSLTVNTRRGKIIFCAPHPKHIISYVTTFSQYKVHWRNSYNTGR